ncbi:MAG: diguanylate cyclase [Planctomycetota bacterium]|nr:diguanylate cyclase [Planctomycetota bacterium]
MILRFVRHCWNRLPRLSATFRIVISLASLSASLVLVAGVVGILPDGRAGVAAGRMRLCESLAIQFATMARSTDVGTMKTSLQTVVGRNPDIQSLGIRREDSTLLLAVGDHELHWTLVSGDKSTATQMVVPINTSVKKWGALEVTFVPLESAGLAGLAARPEFALAGFIGLASLISFYLYLRTVLRQLNPSKVIPGRVREAFDSLSEGLVIMDRQERVILVNRAFEQVTGRSSEELVGQSVSGIQFLNREEVASGRYPWQETLADSRQVRGRLLGLVTDTGGDRTFSVSSAPILDEQGKNRGVMTSFEDVSRLEKKRQELLEMVEHLHASGEAIKRQNQELEFLATRDSLTGCLNRHAFFEIFESHWNNAIRQCYLLAAVMVDVDHFKSVNDQHGHAVGDEVLRGVAATLRQRVREADIVCRYGGEEFAVLLPYTDIAQAAIVAEELRQAIAQLKFPELSVTASLGVSAISENPQSPPGLLEQADKCLYVAKRGGRNQVVRHDQATAEMIGCEGDKSVGLNASAVPCASDVLSIPYHAVTALVSALAFRDQETAAHSRRVADLCVAAAEGLLGSHDCYVLEIAALLHDIGKIGVPDAILLKPGPLTKDEWEVMHRHDGIGVEILRASFQSQALTEIVESHRAFFGGSATRPNLPTGRDICVGGRLLAIADAYDAMTNNRVYRRGRSMEEAIAELRHCAGTQFDPELLERFVRMVKVRTRHELCEEGSLVSKEAALSIGLQIERLMAVLEEQDLDKLCTLSQRLHATAQKFGAEKIAEKAVELESYLGNEPDLYGVMQTANELLDLCRSAQATFVCPIPRKDVEMVR